MLTVALTLSFAGFIVLGFRAWLFCGRIWAKIGKWCCRKGKTRKAPAKKTKQATARQDENEYEGNFCSSANAREPNTQALPGGVSDKLDEDDAAIAEVEKKPRSKCHDRPVQSRQEAYGATGKNRHTFEGISSYEDSSNSGEMESTAIELQSSMCQAQPELAAQTISGGLDHARAAFTQPALLVASMCRVSSVTSSPRASSRP